MIRKLLFFSRLADGRRGVDWIDVLLPLAKIKPVFAGATLIPKAIEFGIDIGATNSEVNTKVEAKIDFMRTGARLTV